MGFEPTHFLVVTERSRVRIPLVTYLFFNRRTLYSGKNEKIGYEKKIFVHIGIRTHIPLRAFVYCRSWEVTGSNPVSYLLIFKQT